MSNTRFNIKIINWEKHQKKLKAGHSHFMLSKRFFDDEKIALLKQNECLLYINLLSIAADLMSDSFVIHAKLMPNLLRLGDKSLQNCLDRLQSFQLLSYEKNALNIKEVNIKEVKLKEMNGSERKKPDPETPDPEKKEITKAVSTKVSKAAVCGCIPEFSQDPIVFEMMESVKQESQKLWVETYKNIPWLIFELKKAKGWIVDNPDRAPKSRFGMFYSKWLSRGFESYRKGLYKTQTRGNWVEEHNRKVIQELDAMESEIEVRSES